jgi:two-component system, chemotaxis family, sensor kinase CheA
MSPDARGGTAAPLPYLRLRDHFALQAAPAPRENVVVVLQGSHQVGLVVDALHGEHQAVVKPLGRLFQDLPGITGSTILGDGRVALILNVSTLAHEAATIHRHSAGGPPPGARTEGMPQYGGVHA